MINMPIQLQAIRADFCSFNGATEVRAQNNFGLNLVNVFFELSSLFAAGLVQWNVSVSLKTVDATAAATGGAAGVVAGASVGAVDAATGTAEGSAGVCGTSLIALLR
jgi:hypothetical protein